MIALCRMFGCLPSALYEEDAEIFRLVNIAGTGALEGGDDGE